MTCLNFTNKKYMLPKNINFDSYNKIDSFNSAQNNKNNSSKFSPAAKIKVIGVGGCGCNAIKRMIEVGVEAVDFWAMNTDLQSLKSIHADGIVQLGSSITRGLGAGMAPEIGKQAAEECTDEIESALTGADMVFITAGMGGGTGTGAAPVVAEIAKRLGILTIAVVTKPFHFEGVKRMQLAEDGVERLKQSSDAVLVVPNQKLLQIVAKNTTLSEAFKTSDDVLRQAVQGISNLINVPGIINVDFADVRSVMANAGTALMGMGRAQGTEGAAMLAAMQAVESPLIELSIDGAKGVLINIEGGKNLTLFDVNEAAASIQSVVDPEAKIIFGYSTDESMQDEVRVTVVATGFTGEKNEIKNDYAQDVSYAKNSTNDYGKYANYNNGARNNSKFLNGSVSKNIPQPSTLATNTTSESLISNSELDNLEIPAFLRNRRKY